MRLAQCGVRCRQDNRHDGPAATCGRSCRSARVGDVSAMSAAACQAGRSRRRPAGTFRHPGSDIGEPTGVPAPAPPPCPPPVWTALPRSSSAASARRRWLPRQAAAAPRPAPQGGRSRRRLSTCAPIAGAQPGRVRAGTGDLDCCAGHSLADAAVSESTMQRHTRLRPGSAESFLRRCGARGRGVHLGCAGAPSEGSAWPAAGPARGSPRNRGRPVAFG